MPTCIHIDRFFSSAAQSKGLLTIFIRCLRSSLVINNLTISEMSLLEILSIWEVEAQRPFNVGQEKYSDFFGFQSMIRFALRLSLNIEGAFKNNSQ